MDWSEEFTPIRVSTLRGDFKIPFDAYLKLGERYVLYCRKGSSFEGERLERLRSKRLRKMYIRKEHDIPYRQYLEESIESAYADSGKPIEIRAEVIQGFQQFVIEEFMDEPTDKLTYEHVQSSSQRFLEFVQNEPRASEALLKIKNIDQSVSHHGVNVATLSVCMLQNSDLSKEYPAIHLALGGMLHDIEHFFSPVNLETPVKQKSKAELAAYKAHPLEGARRMQGVSFVDQLVHQIIMQHEENAKGTGYPKGLYEKDMDPAVLLTATANAYERLISFEQMEAKAALKHLLIDKMGEYPLGHLQNLQSVLKQAQIA